MSAGQRSTAPAPSSARLSSPSPMAKETSSCCCLFSRPLSVAIGVHIMKKQTVGFILAVFVAIQAQAANGPPGAPKITFSGNTVQASGVTPGGIVVIYGVAILRGDNSNTLIRCSKALRNDDTRL